MEAELALVVRVVSAPRVGAFDFGCFCFAGVLGADLAALPVLGARTGVDAVRRSAIGWSRMAVAPR